MRADEDDPLNEWPSRRVPLAAYIKSQDVDFFGVQEAFLTQLQYLNITVDNRNYNWTGRGRDDGIEAGEHAAIFYDMDKFELLDSDTFWFTDTPDVPSNVPGDRRRICSWGMFQDKSTLNEFFVYCTHYGFTPWFQIIASMMINNHVAAHTADLPVIVMGDFNMPNIYPFYLYMEGWGSKPLYEAYGMKHGYVNPFGATSLLTWDINFQIGFHIDYMFVSTNVYVESCEVLRDSYDGIHTYSDHQPVLMSCWFE
jgi:endonuclease/exonuclease/phosphatase family metal-dependent hydrolase